MMSTIADRLAEAIARHLGMPREHVLARRDVRQGVHRAQAQGIRVEFQCGRACIHVIRHRWWLLNDISAKSVVESTAVEAIGQGIKRAEIICDAAERLAEQLTQAGLYAPGIAAAAHGDLSVHDRPYGRECVTIRPVGDGWMTAACTTGSDSILTKIIATLGPPTSTD